MFCSTIIPTINRSTLPRTVQSVLDQNFMDEDFEVIVVNDSGTPLPDMPWMHSSRVRIIDTNCRERSVARNTGAAIARGKYLHFLDDDDILLPGAIQAFWKLAQTDEHAEWLNGAWRIVDNHGNTLNEFYPNLRGNIFARLVSGEGLPLQASLVKAEAFFSVGAYDTAEIIIGVEDRDVGRRLALHGNMTYTPALVAEVRIGEVGSSTNWNKIAEGDRWGREKALQAPNSMRRLRISAESSYWYGRVSRALFASMVWNMKQRNVLIAAGRLVSGLIMTSWRIFLPDYWRGLGTKIQ